MFTYQSFAVLLLSLASASPGVQQPAKTTQGERPSQAAVLAQNTLVLADRAYGPDAKQRLDVYAPRESKAAPIVVFVHGGEWTRGDKADVSYKPRFFNEHGIVLVSINYRLSPPAKHPDHVNDVAGAVRWVRDHAAEFGGDPRKVVLMGHSAGCHLVTLVALDRRYLEGVKLRPTDLCGVVAWSGGMYDLADRAKGEGMYPKYIRQAFGETESAWRDASPAAHVGDAKMPPFLFVSIEKGNASHKAAESLAQAIRAAGGSAQTRLLEGRSHFMANHLVGAPGDTTGQLVLDFLRKVTP